METHTNYNPQLALAYDFVEQTGRHLFLTGKAGTGKTTFLRNLKERSPKRMIVVAPTGVAAINAGGVTIHSFFQLPFGPIIPGFSKGDNQSFFRFSRDKRNIIKSLDLLVIDEISMVRADLLDGIDEVLRRFRRNNQPFGGVQMLMIGDMQQLPPVVRDVDWDLLRKHYQTAYFYGSQALGKSEYVTITLEHVYRQQDQQFLDILNKIRDKQVDNAVIDTLKERYKPGFDGEDHYITLTTHNAKAKEINESRLNRLKAKEVQFSAVIRGNFPEYNFPTEQHLALKVGAQVMFVKNDPESEKRFYNGKIGTVSQILEDEVVVKCPEDDTEIWVKALEWQNIKYTIDDDSKAISEEIEGVFQQIPLKLAWAITIHKSQGLTFDKVIIDSSQAFAHGQVYTALSRCRTIEGLVLSSPFSPYSLKQDRNIEAFHLSIENKQPDRKELSTSIADYQRSQLLELFNFNKLQKELHWFIRLLRENIRSLSITNLAPLEEIQQKSQTKIADVAEKFIQQIGELLQRENKTAEENEALQQRIRQAVPYFLEHIQKELTDPLEAFAVETDSREVRKNIEKSEERLNSEINLKVACLNACRHGFLLSDYLREKAKASLESLNKRSGKKQQKVIVNDEIKNPGLYNRLKRWRNAKSSELGISVFMVLPLKTIRALSNYVPSTWEDMVLIPGLGKKKLERFGQEILDLLNTYREDHSVEAEPLLRKKTAVPPPKKPTREISLELWRKHRDIQMVAQERGLVVSTIEGHLAHYVGTGDLAVEDFVEKDKLDQICTFMNEQPDASIGEAKNAMGDGYTYAELRFVHQHLKLQGNDDG